MEKEGLVLCKLNIFFSRAVKLSLQLLIAYQPACTLPRVMKIEMGYRL